MTKTCTKTFYIRKEKEEENDNDGQKMKEEKVRSHIKKMKW